MHGFIAVVDVANGSESKKDPIETMYIALGSLQIRMVNKSMAINEVKVTARITGHFLLMYATPDQTNSMMNQT